MHKKFIIILVLLCSCNSQDTPVEENTNSEKKNVQVPTLDSFRQTKDSTTALHYEFVTVFDENNGWGYKILQNGAPYINQPHIPAISGMKAFDSESDASRTATLVIYKLEHGIMPPSVSVNELDSIGVLY